MNSVVDPHERMKFDMPQYFPPPVSIYLAAKRETSVTGDVKAFYWVEFVDREALPNYVSQRGVDVRHLPTHGMSKEEIFQFGKSAALEVATEMAEEMIGTVLFGS